MGRTGKWNVNIFPCFFKLRLIIINVIATILRTIYEEGILEVKCNYSQSLVVKWLCKVSGLLRKKNVLPHCSYYYAGELRHL
jgi:hypothetical protein